MGVDLLQVGVSGLLTSQQRLGTTGHNIANVNTDGFSRQTILQETSSPVRAGNNFAGTGTRISQIERVFDQFRYNEVVFNQTLDSAAQTTASKMQRLDETMSLIGKSISTSLNDLFSAVNSLVDVPGDIGLREVMLSKADTLSKNMSSVQSALDAEYNSVNEDLESSATNVTEIAEQLAALNRDIVKASANNSTPSDLLDKRDNLVKELSSYTSVSTVETNDGALNVYMAGGQTLVTGTTHFSVGVDRGNPDPRQTQIYIQSPSGAKQGLPGSSIGGSMGALIGYRDGVLSDTMNKLGQTAITVADAFNTAQSQGMDLNGLQGQNLFKDINDTESSARRFLTDFDNTGTLTGAVDITDVNQLSSDDYRLEYDGTNYTLTNQSTGESQVLTPENPAAPVGSRTYATSDGFTFKETGGAPANGDSFIIQPTRLGATNLTVNLTQPEQIATSSIVEVYADDENVNTAKLEITSVDNTGAAGFPSAGNDLTLEVYEAPAGTFNYRMLDSSGTAQPLFDENGAALGTTATYTSSPLKFQAAGMSFQLNGLASGEGVNAPERYKINYAVGEGNNKNALEMASLVDKKMANQGRSTMNDLYEESVTSVGSATATANIEASAARTLFSQAEARMSNTSGVNLDEEASNMLRFQQAYSASARVISTANEIFNTLLQAAR
ncbi:flagellar hook-associated protein FlgK [Psychrobium sp. MM17-31]|uniref:flagellar hook-associated protein FlgK n=1 Tax=Psychrobium sp. MM17-31 TaxID=2917758 RepID=UPI001EF5EBD4|nr:flagellar hook-associated protein FlgK [Psychrobium sp. MM17-31]MCG7530125.1 flagellar hook-associated protein FlgK [Psychrobium sp. MM17-31]